MVNERLKYEYHRKCNRNSCAHQPKDHCNREKIGVLCAVSDGPRLKFGWSLCNIHLDKFTREQAIIIAMERLDDDIYKVLDALPQSMQKHFQEFTKQCRKYYKQCYRPTVTINDNSTSVAWKRPDNIPTRHGE